MAERAKAAGKIRHIGFSFHDELDVFKEILNGYDGWEFCQLQLNYMDVEYQAGLEGMRLAHEKGLAVVVMEPLRGGKLVNNLPESALKIFANHPKGYTPAQWAFRWLWNQREVTVVLSGMNSMEMVLDNVATASAASDIGHYVQLIKTHKDSLEFLCTATRTAKVVAKVFRSAACI